MNWTEACNFVGYNPECNPPERLYTYFAYHKGKAVECKTEQEAKKLSINVEKVVTNQEEIDIYWEQRSSFESKASDVFHKALRDKYNHLKDDVYKLCYSKAYEDGHSCGYDEVASYLRDYVEFAENIIKASKEKYDGEY